MSHSHDHTHTPTRIVALLLLAGLLSGSGCSLAVTERVQVLGIQHIPACIYTTRHLLPFVMQREIAATGGMTVGQCHELR